MIRSADESISGIEALMRDEDIQNQTLFSYVRTDDRIPSNHPPRLIRRIADAALAALSGENADERIRGAAYLTMAMPAYQLA